MGRHRMATAIGPSRNADRESDRATQIVDPARLRLQSTILGARVLADARTSFGALVGPPDGHALPAGTAAREPNRCVIVRGPPVPRPDPDRARRIAYDRTRIEDLAIPDDIAPKRNQRLVATEPIVRRRRPPTPMLTLTHVDLGQRSVPTQISATRLLHFHSVPESAPHPSLEHPGHGLMATISAWWARVATSLRGGPRNAADPVPERRPTR